MRTYFVLTIVLILSLPALAVGAGGAKDRAKDLRTAVADLKARLDSQARHDTARAASGELEQARRAFLQAKGAFKRGDRVGGLRLLQQVALRLETIEGLIVLSQVRARLEQAQRALAETRRAIKSLQEKVATREQHVEALRRMR